MRALGIALLCVATTAHADERCPFEDGGTLVQELPLGCPLEIFHPAAFTTPHADTITVVRDGQPVELAVVSSMAVTSRVVPVRFDRPSATCAAEEYTEQHELDGIALGVDGLQLGDVFSDSHVVAAGPCPTRLDGNIAAITWLACSAPVADYERCCTAQSLAPDCYEPVPPPLDDGGGCCTSRGSQVLPIALLMLALVRYRRRREGSGVRRPR